MCIVFSIHVLRNHTQCYEKIAGSQCNLYIGECHCPDDHPLVIRSQCMAPVEVDSWCEDDIQCQYHDNNTNCHQHKCQCHQDFIMSKTKTCIEGKKNTIFAMYNLLIYFYQQRKLKKILRNIKYYRTFY